MTYEERHAIEEQIVRRVVADALAAGYSLGVNDGEETTLRRCSDYETVLKAMFTTDEDYLQFYRSPLEGICGVVRFVYGNDGWDVICDNSGSVNHVLKQAEALAECFAEQAVA